MSLNLKAEFEECQKVKRDYNINYLCDGCTTEQKEFCVITKATIGKLKPIINWNI
jgi:hypothetical protein